jgi:hypothetical protein
MIHGTVVHFFKTWDQRLWSHNGQRWVVEGNGGRGDIDIRRVRERVRAHKGKNTLYDTGSVGGEGPKVQSTHCAWSEG